MDKERRCHWCPSFGYGGKEHHFHCGCDKKSYKRTKSKYRVVAR